MTTRRGEDTPGEHGAADEASNEAAEPTPEAEQTEPAHDPGDDEQRDARADEPADADADADQDEAERASERPATPRRKPADPDDDEPDDAATDARKSREAPWWDVGGSPFTQVYWASLAALVLGLFRIKLLPFVDYPQHLALAATLKRMIVGGGPERQLFETNLASYNSLFHILVATANFVVPIDVAGKLVLALYVFLIGYAALALLRATGRPRARAFLVVPVVFGYSIIWGFVNFGLGMALQLVVLARVLDHDRLLREGAAATGWRRFRPDLITMGIALLGAYTHLLATALGYMLMLVAIVVRAETEKRPFFERLGRALRTGLPLLPAVAWCGFVYWRQTRGSFQNFEYGVAEGNDLPWKEKVENFLTYATGLRWDGGVPLDAKILSIGLGLLLLGALLRDPEDDPPPALRWLFLVSVAAYLRIPHVFWATNFVFERITLLIVLTAVIWAPRAMPRFEYWLRMMYVSVGLAAAGSFFLFMGNPDVQKEMGDLDAVLDLMPKARRVTGLLWDPTIREHLPPPEPVTAPRGQITAQYCLLHTPAYYVARNGGEVAFSFTRTMSLPVHYKKETMPPDPPPNFEWQPDTYRPNTSWGRYFDLVLVKTQWDDNVDPRASIFGRHASEVGTLLHRGKWWVFEAKDVSADLPELTPPELDPLLEPEE